MTRRLVALATLLLIGAACSSSDSVMQEGPWTTVPLPDIQPLVVISSDGQRAEVESVCVTAEGSGAFDAERAKDTATGVLKDWFLQPEVGENCDGELIVKGRGSRTCDTYAGASGGATCCLGWSYSGEMTLSINGQERSDYAFRDSESAPSVIGETQCDYAPEETEPLSRLGAVREGAETLLGVPGWKAYSTCDFSKDLLDRLFATLHLDPPIIEDGAESAPLPPSAVAARAIEACLEKGELSPELEMRAVPHLIHALGTGKGGASTLVTISGESYGNDVSAWWDWWTQQSSAP